MRRFIRLWTAAWTVFGASALWAQGLLIVVDRPVPLPRPIPIPRPVPSATYAIKEISVQAKLLDQVARVQVSQSFVNTGNVQMEVQFLFPLPYDGAIDQLTLLVDGKEYPAQLLPAKEARARYEAIVRSNRDPALLEWMGQGMFQTSVFPVPPGAERKVSLSYNQLLRKDHGLTDFIFPLSTAKYTSKPVQKVDVQISIESGVEIKNVYSPTHPIEIQRPDAKHAIVKWSRTNEVPGSDFRLLYDVGKTGLAARVVTYRPSDSDDGYFLLLASPPIVSTDAERPKKTVMFVVDKSGSMSGKKIEQAKGALKFVLNNLREGDLFNIVAYDGVVESFRPELEKFNDETRKAAIGYVEGLYAGGGTNIHDALTTALNQLKDSSRPNFVIFLTDGLPTIGERNESKIVVAAKSSNSVRARVLPFGVGYDVNSRLLDRVARENFGLSEYVRPEEDIEASVSKVYNRIGSPVMTDVSVKIEFDAVRVEDAAPINRVYPKQVVDLFEGEQLVQVGRYKKSGAAKVVIEGRTGSTNQRFDFPADFSEKSPNASFAFVEKLWATRRIGEIIDQIDLHGKNDELVKELVDLSTKHGILTPYTTFLADETARPRDLASSDRYRRAADGIVRLEEAEGISGVAQRATKLGLQTAPNAPAAGGFDGSGLGGAVIRDINSDKEVRLRGVREAGNKAYYVRQNAETAAAKKLLVTQETAQLDPEKDKDSITVVERYSDAYFELIRANSNEDNQLLAQQQADEEFLIQLRGKNYLVK
jgi:Ca-activated chloride channel family protein